MSVGSIAWLLETRRALRRLTSSNHFSLISIATLVLAVGANLAVFAVVNALWLKPRGITEPERVVMLLGSNERGGSYSTMYWSTFGLSQLSRHPVFSAITGQVPTAGELSGNMLRLALPSSREIEAVSVMPNYFETLGVPLTGRSFSALEDGPAVPTPAVISYDLWAREFNRADVIGKTISTSPASVIIVGIAPAQFHGARAGERFDVWLPRTATVTFAAPGLGQTDPNVLAIARLRQGVGYGEVERLVSESYPVRVVPIDRLYGTPTASTIAITQQPVVYVALIAGLIVLLGGCMSIMSVARAHYEARNTEFRIMMALGCSGPRLLRSLLLEVAIVIAAGSVGAFVVGYLVLAVLPSLALPGGLELNRLDLRPDALVAMTAFAICSAAMAVSTGGALRRAVHTKAGYLVRVAGEAPTSLKARKVMLGTQVGVATAIMLVAGTLVQSVVSGHTKGAGFSSDKVTFVEFTHKQMGVTALDEHTQALAGLVSRLTDVTRLLSTLPGIDTVSLGSAPISVDSVTAAVRPRLVMLDGSPRTMALPFLPVGTEYRRALGLRLLVGRDLAAQDVRGPAEPGDHPVLITASLARELSGEESPIGKRISISPKYAFLVVGVVSDFVIGSHSLRHTTAVLEPIDAARAARDHRVRLAVASAVRAEALRDEIKRVIDELGHFAAVTVATGDEIIDRDLGQNRLGAVFFGWFGFLSAALGSCSVFGLVSQLAVRRRREIGVRLALGGTSTDVSKLLIGNSMLPVGLGLSAGLAAGLFATVILSSFLRISDGFHAVPVVSSAVLILGAAVIAGVIATAQIRRTDPSQFLRA